MALNVLFCAVKKLLTHSHLQSGKPSWYVASHPGQLSLAIRPRGTCNECQQKLGHKQAHARCTATVWQCKLVSG